MNRDHRTGAGGGEARAKIIEGGENDKVDHKPDRGAAGAALHDAVE